MYLCVHKNAVAHPNMYQVQTALIEVLFIDSMCRDAYFPFLSTTPRYACTYLYYIEKPTTRRPHNSGPNRFVFHLKFGYVHRARELYLSFFFYFGGYICEPTCGRVSALCVTSFTLTGATAMRSSYVYLFFYF